LPVDLGFPWLLLGGQPRRLLFACLAPALVLSSWDHTWHIGLRQTLELLGDAHRALPQGFCAGLELLGEPMAAMGPLQGLGHTLRGGQPRTPVVPDERVKWLGRTVACLTAVVMRRVNRLGRAATPIVAMAMRGRTGKTGRLTDPTAD
jgi:hypothetical protein